MSVSRTAVRSARTVRSRPVGQNFSRRYQSTNPSSSSSSSSAPNSHTHSMLYGGLAGGVVAVVGGYGWYHFSGAKTMVNTAHQAKSYYESTMQKAKQAAPEPNEALQWLRQQSSFYAGFVPGGKGVVDSTFNDIDSIRNKHGKEVDQIVTQAYNELKDVTNKGLSVETAQEAWTILQKHMKRIGELAGDAAEDIMNNHPEIKQKVGGNLDQLKSMGDKYGPEAKKQVDETWSQISDIIKGGVSFGSVEKIRQLVQDKVEKLKKLGDEAWQKGMEEAKPYLDKSPKVKELVEKNKDALKSGNAAELWQKVKQATESGSTKDLESYVNDTIKKAKEGGSGGGLEQYANMAKDQLGGGNLDKYLNMIPGGSEIIPKFEQIQKISEKHGPEAEKLIKETMKEIQDVLSKKVDEGKKLADKASKN